MHMTIWKITAIIIIAILILNIYDKISTILTNVGSYIDAKTENVKTENLIKREKKIEISRNYIDLIDYMINNEISRIIETYSLLKNRYDVIRLDEDLEIVATAIYSGLKKDFLQDNSIIFTNEYMMEYITNRSRLLLFNAITEYNALFSKTPEPIE